MGPSPIGGDTDEGAGLRRVLERSRDLGLLGDGPIETHLDNGELFRTALVAHGLLRRGAADGPPQEGSVTRLLDLGSGGGVPGLVLAVRCAGLSVTLLESQRRRCEFLRWSIGELALGDRVGVAEGRAEDLAHQPSLRGRFRAVTARSFGPPAVTAECAVAFLDRPGAVLLVSEPPGAPVPGRWPEDGLARLGLVPGPRSEGTEGAVQSIVLDTPAAAQVPRRTGVPGKRPVF